MILKFLVYFFLVFQVREAFSASTPILLMVEDGAYFEPFLYRISAKGKGSIFFLGVEHLDYPLQSFHPMIYRLIASSGALLFEDSNQDIIDSLNQYSTEYEELGIDVNKKIKQLTGEAYEGESFPPTFETQIKFMIQRDIPEKPMFGLDDPETLLNISKVSINSFSGIPRSDSENVRLFQLFMKGDSQGLYDSEYNPKNIGTEGGPTQEQVLKVRENNKFLLDERNQLWYQRVRELMRLPNMQEATFFGIVGVYHLLPENPLSLLSIFKYMGYQVHRITNQDLAHWLGQLNQNNPK